MKFHIDGSETIRAPVEKVYSSLCDPQFMATCIPDLQSLNIVDSNHFEAKVKVGISIVRGTVDLKFALVNKQDGSHAVLIGDGAGSGSKIHIESTFDLSPEAGGTRMNWFAEADLSGLIAGIGSQIIRGQSEKQVAAIFQNIKSKLEG